MVILSDMSCSSKLFSAVAPRLLRFRPTGRPARLGMHLAHRGRRPWTALSKAAFSLFTIT